MTLHLIGQGKQLICNRKGGTSQKHKVMINSNKLSTDVHPTKKALHPLRLLPTNSEESSEEYIETPKGKVKQASPLWQLPTI